MADNEKLIEKTLAAEITKLGGWSFKLPCVYVSGLPDRLCLLPGGVIFFAELKSTGKKPTAVQKLIHEKIRRLGFEVYVIDSIEQLLKILNTYLE
jgi:hypothetical protein